MAKMKTLSTKSTVTQVEPEAAAEVVAAAQAAVDQSYDRAPELGAKTIGVPLRKRPPVASIQGGCFWIYGVEKIGKTTFASNFPGVWFWATEPGQNWIEAYEPTIIQSWDHLLDLCVWIQQEKPTTFGDGAPIRTIAIDTGDLLFKMCSDYVSQSLGIEDPSELDHGKGWARLNNEFERVITKIRRWPFTLVIISHARQRPFKTKGRQVDRMEPSIGAGGHRVFAAAADLILYAHADDVVEKNEDGEPTGNIIEQRMLQCHPSASIVAGGRMSNRLPKKIPLDYATLHGYLTGELTPED